MWLDVSPGFSIELNYMFNLVVIYFCVCSKNILIFISMGKLYINDLANNHRNEL